MRLGIGTWIAGGASGIGGLVSQLAYLLRATFTRANTGALANGTVLNSAALGVENGSLTVVDTSTGTVEVLSNQLKMVGSVAWNTTGFYGTAVTQTFGKFLTGSFNSYSGATGGLFIGWTSTADVAIGSVKHVLVPRVSSTGILGYYNGVYEADVATVSPSTTYDFGLLLGGYDVNGVPYKNGDTKANFTYGTTCFIKGGIYTNWTLVWKSHSITPATSYPAVSSYDYTLIIDNLRIPDSDLSAVLQPTVLDTFTDTNGTALTAHTPEIGGTWVSRLGAMDIQSNKANSTGTDLGQYFYSIDSGIANCVLECVSTAAAGNYVGLVARVVAGDDLWWINIGVGILEINERTPAGWTQRATTTGTFTAGTDYKITAILDGTTISAYAGTVKVSYASATRNQSVTSHGIGMTGVSEVCTQFAVFPRTSATYESQFGGV